MTVHPRYSGIKKIILIAAAICLVVGSISAAALLSGFETAFCVSNTELVRAGHMTLSQLIEKMSVKPAQLLGVPGGELTVGSAADIVVLDPEREITVDAEKFVSRGHNTPFHGHTYFGAVCATIVGGRVIDQE